MNFNKVKNMKKTIKNWNDYVPEIDGDYDVDTDTQYSDDDSENGN